MRRDIRHRSRHASRSPPSGGEGRGSTTAGGSLVTNEGVSWTRPGGRIDGHRVVDVVLASVLILLTLPVMLLAAIGSAIALRAWPFFTQHRVGRGGDLFLFVKIRTLPVDTPRYTDKHQLQPAAIPRFC